MSRSAVLGLCAVSALLTSVAGCPGRDEATISAVDVKVRLARDYSRIAMPPAVPGVVVPTLTATGTREWVRRRARLLPLPSGGNFEGIRWEAATPMPSLSEVDGVLQYNARCQWQRAVRDGREVTDGEAVLAAAERWPALVSSRSSGSWSVTTSQSLAACDASHARQQRYAADRGAEPSS